MKSTVLQSELGSLDDELLCLSVQSCSECFRSCRRSRSAVRLGVLAGLALLIERFDPGVHEVV
eukprot:2096742-Heterocapsa_arctica.AAC.1